MPDETASEHGSSTRGWEGGRALAGLGRLFLNPALYAFSLFKGFALHHFI